MYKYAGFFVMALLMCFFVPQTASAWDLHNGSNSKVGAIDSDGTVRAANSAIIGKISSSGAVHNKSNSKVGQIESDGRIKGRNGSQVGKIDLSDGRVFNGSNSQIGKIDSSGTVYNGSNSRIGSARGVPRAWAAVFFFFNDFN